MAIYVIGISISGPLSIIFFMLQQWMFAYKYWTLSYKIEAIVKREQSPDLTLMSRLNFAVILNIVVW